MELDVEDPAAFVALPGSELAMETAVAEVADVLVSAVEVDLSVGTRSSRRLRDERQLQAGSEYVIVDATISVADAAAATTLATAVAAVSVEDFQNATTTALQAAGINVVVNVSSVAAVAVGLPDAPAPAPSTLSGTASCANLKWKISSFAPVFAVFSWLLSQAC